MRKPVLLIMARAPRFGAVKTRLAKDIGRMNAWRFYRDTLFAAARRLSQDPRWTTLLQVTPERENRPGRQWPRTDGLVKQGRGDIGTRMARGLTAFPRGTPVVLIGSDIPGVTADHIQRAFQALGHADVTFGPATDGGYWLVGFANRRPIRMPFANVRWSSEQALGDTLRNFSQRRITLTGQLNDVDDGAGYALHLQRLRKPHGRGA